MAEGRLREEWRQTSHLLAMIANCHLDPQKSRAFQAADFDPFADLDRAKTPRPLVGVEALKAVFIDGKTPVG